MLLLLVIIWVFPHVIFFILHGVFPWSV